MQHESLFVAGLRGPASIAVDRWGIPHLTAASREDAFFLQGFNAARDRLWQIDLWRKRGLGLLAADFGPGFLEQDRASRLFLYRGDMAAEWASYGPGAEAICARFAEGINAYVALTEREPARLPPEFALMGTRPARWAAEDVVRIRSHGLTRNALWEVARLNVLAGADAAADLLRKNVEPARVPVPEPGIRAARIPVEALDLFRLGSAGVTFTPERLAATRAQAGAWRKVSDANEVLRDLEWQGSNNWAVAGSRTGTGMPVLASDPHRAHAVPSLRYLVHLSAPGLDLIGAGEPSAPGISFGHNGWSAFAMTIFPADQEDVYLLDLDPADPGRYRFGEGTEAIRTAVERIPVKGGDDAEVTLEFSRQGPIVWRDPAGGRAVAVRSVWFDPGAAPYMQSLAMMEARTLDAFRDRARRWGAPSANEVYADRSGTIAWMPCGYVPVRRGWDGLLPVPGDGRFEWDGLLDQAELPNIVDPAQGYVATANELNLPADWPHDRHPVSFEWSEASRARRIHEVLGTGGTHGVAEAQMLQTDTLAMPARRMARLFAALEPADDAARRALGFLAGWDHHLAAGSAAAALFELWWTKHLKPALFARLVPDETVRKLLVPGDVEAMLLAVEHPDDRWGTEPAAQRDDLLLETLAAAWRDCSERLGGDAAGWAWGRLHHGAFDHGLRLVGGGEGWNVGKLPIGGSSSTPMNAGYRPSDFRVMHGASFRMVVDLADWDRSVCINSPGQSGDPRSPHYADLAPLWAEGQYVPMLYSAAAVADATETLITLEPAP